MLSPKNRSPWAGVVKSGDVPAGDTVSNGGDEIPTTRASIINIADETLAKMQYILVERGATYSDISDNSAVFAQIMRAMGVVTPEGMSDTEFHCMANIATKLARIASGDRRHQDSWLDMANYAVLNLSNIVREN
jgi:hypothetical protein